MAFDSKQRSGWATVAWVWLVACGGSDATPDAAGSLDGSPPIDAPGCESAQPVTAIAPSFSTAMPLSVTVLSHDASGAACGMATGSGEDAHVTIAAPPGGMVTMALDRNGSRSLFTWTGVKAGDELRAPSEVAAGIATQTVHVAMTIPALAGASSYAVTILCEDGGATTKNAAAAGALALDVTCQSPGNAVASFVSATTSAGTQIAASDPTPIAASGSTTIALGAWTPASRPTVTLHGATSFGGASVGFSPGPTTTFFGSTMEFVSPPSITDPLPVQSGAVPPAWPMHVSVAVSVLAMPVHTLALGRDLATPTSVDVSVAGDFLPLVDGSLVAGFPRPEVSFTLAASTPADIAYINVGHWMIAVPAQPGTVRFPVVPADLLPAGAASLLAINVVDASGLAGFEDARRDSSRVYGETSYRLSSVGSTYRGIIP